MSIPSRKPIHFDLPATYQVCVEGCLDQTISDLLGVMTICPATVEADPPVTILQGVLSDQAALVGVLNALYEMHLTVISVNRMEI